MLKLIYNDLIDETTFTSTIMNEHQKEIEYLEQKLARMKAFNLALTNYLQTNKEMDFKSYNRVMVWFNHSNLSIPEIFQKIQETP